MIRKLVRAAPIILLWVFIFGIAWTMIFDQPNLQSKIGSDVHTGCNGLAHTRDIASQAGAPDQVPGVTC